MAMRIMRKDTPEQGLCKPWFKITAFRFRGNQKRYIYGVGIIFVKLKFEAFQPPRIIYWFYVFLGFRISIFVFRIYHTLNAHNINPL